jgi:hypothetical protein
MIYIHGPNCYFDTGELLSLIEFYRQHGDLPSTEKLVFGVPVRDLSPSTLSLFAKFFFKMDCKTLIRNEFTAKRSTEKP